MAGWAPHSKRQPARIPHGLQAVAVQSVVLVAGLGTNILVARVFGPEAKGSLALLITGSGIAAIVVSLGLESAITHYGASDGAAKSEGITVRASGFMIVASCIIAAAVWATGLGGEAPIVAASIALGGIRAAQSLYIGLYLGRKRMRSYFRSRLLSGLILPFALLLVAVLYPSKSDVQAVLTGFVVSTILSLVVVGLVGGRFKPVWPDVDEWRRHLRYGVKGYLSNLAQIMNYRLDFLILGSLASTRDVGVYSAGVAVSESVWNLPSALAPLVFSSSSEGDATTREGRSRLTRISMLIVAVACIVLAIGMQFFIPLLFGSDFKSAVLPAQILLVGSLTMSGLKFLGAEVAGMGHPEKTTYATLVALLVTVVGDVVLVPSFGIAGAAVASSIAYTAALLALVLILGSGGLALALRVLAPTLDDLAFVASALVRRYGR